ncbi:dna-directed rna polymerases i ii and iii subunit rpabc2 [Holotrichia oblita]|uniref:Dna-directed rna polymerases i ii and iii subunit rpabc2 n=1 Tax=Holotrichia oblita TaxID=644536 RepID=A0ACB9SJV2_HOLOL|nr:dna-directed rna polymerases i ii and iii subunit rpabc2 [Holotrichia oblita]
MNETGGGPSREPQLNEYERKTLGPTFFKGVGVQELVFFTIRIKTDADAKERQTVRSFYFEKGGMKIRICQAFFLKTLAISNGSLINAFQNKNSSGVYAEEDKRGKHRPINKTSDDQISKIKQHIGSFSITESHYD